MWNKCKLSVFLFLCGFVAQAATLSVVSSVPARGQEDVALDTVIYIEFNQELDQYTVDDYSVALVGSSYELTGKVSYLPDLKRIVFKPQGRLEKGEQYVLKVFAGVRGMDGSRLARDYVAAFDTGRKKDLVIPQIASCFPEPGSSNIPVIAEIQVVFSEAVDTKSLEGAVRLQGGKKSRPIKVEYLKEKQLLLVKVSGDLEYETTYRLIIQKQICDLSGNHLAEDHVLEFTTEKEPDRTAPEILATLPRDGQLEVENTVEIIVKVTEMLGESSLSPDNMYLETDKERVLCRISYNPVISEIRGIPEKELKEDTDYQLVIGGFSDLSGNKIKPARIKFRTRRLGDTTPPELVEFSPADGASDIPLNAPVVLRFTEPVAKLTLNEGVILTDADVIVECGIEFDESGTVVELKPKSELRPNCHYRMTVKKQITDLSGNALVEGRNIGFVTVVIREDQARDLVKSPPLDDANRLEAELAEITGVPLVAPLQEIRERELPQDSTPLDIIDYFPVDGFKGVALDTRISFIFSKELEEKTLVPQNITIKQGDMDYQVGIIYDYEYKKLTLTPNSIFMPQREVRVVLGPGIKDRSGNSLKETKIVFTTGDSLDSEIEIKLSRKDAVLVEGKTPEPLPSELIPLVEDADFYGLDSISQNFTRDEWARYLVERLQQIFVPKYEIKARDDFLKPSRYELAMIVNKIVSLFLENDAAYLFRSRKGIAKVLLLEQGVIEFEREL
ncbi:MAG: Ig-like domain-containing protein, partial [Candidatus Wallbacteria bacterium]|nr:Ig-like domain-containing protein [Candidatus Wallbacteria bacterium]